MSSGERKRMMVKPCACDDPAGVACAGLWGCPVVLLPEAGRVESAGSRIVWEGVA